MKLTRAVDFDPMADLERVAELAAAWRSLFRPAEVAYTPENLAARVLALDRAESARLYLVTRPRRPVALAILDGFRGDELIQLMALAPAADPDLVRPFEQSPGGRREMMRDAPQESTGRGVWAFILGDPEGEAWLDLEPEGLVMAMALWGGRNVLDPEPLLAQRLNRLGRQIMQRGRPDGEG